MVDVVHDKDPLVVWRPETLHSAEVGNVSATAVARKNIHELRGGDSGQEVPWQLDAPQEIQTVDLTLDPSGFCCRGHDLQRNKFVCGE